MSRAEPTHVVMLRLPETVYAEAQRIAAAEERPVAVQLRRIITDAIRKQQEEPQHAA